MASPLEAFGLPDDRPFTSADLAAAGVPRRLVRQWLSGQVLRRPVKGVYLAEGCADSIELRVACLRLVMPDDCFAADHTASWLIAGDAALPPGADLTVLAPAFFRPASGYRLHNDLCRSGERDVRPTDLVEVGGIACTSPLRTAWDLGRLEHADMALWSMDLMLRTGGFGREELIRGAERFRGFRGVVQLRTLTPWVDPGSESFAEAALRRRWWQAGLPRPVTQISLTVDGHEVARVDMGLPDLLWGAEYDGEEWHREADREADAQRRRMIRRGFGYDIDPFRREQVFGRTQDAEIRLRHGYDQARAGLGRKRHFLR